MARRLMASSRGLRSMQRKMRDVDCVIEVPHLLFETKTSKSFQVHDARIPFSGRNLTFREVVGGARPHILVLNKADLVPDKDLAAIRWQGKQLLVMAIGSWLIKNYTP